MKYMGSKARIAKEILPIILKDRKPGQWYVEPFVGGANSFDKVDNPRLGGDIHEYGSALLDAMSRGWTPPERITEQDYHNVKKCPMAFEKALVGYCGFSLSYGGKWFGGWCRDGAGVRDYRAEAFRHITAQSKLLQGAIIYRASYDQLDIPPNSIIYCDPPYAGTTKYRDAFGHEAFWRWCEQKVAEGHQVFVSEYTAPENWRCVWEKEQVSSLTKDTGSKRAIERLFTLDSPPPA